MTINGVATVYVSFQKLENTMPASDLKQYIKKDSDYMNFKLPAALITIIAAFFIINSFSVYADDIDADDIDSDVILVDSFPDHSDQDLFSDPVPEVTDLIPEVTDFPFPVITVTTTESTDLYVNNEVLDYAYNELLNRIFEIGSDYDITITYPDSFALNAGTLIGQVIYSDLDQLFRHYFITKILEYLGIDPDNPFYEIFYDVVGNYYDDLTGQSEEDNAASADVLLLSLCGMGVSLGVIKWIMF